MMEGVLLGQASHAELNAHIYLALAPSFPSLTVAPAHWPLTVGGARTLGTQQRLCLIAKRMRKVFAKSTVVLFVYMY